MIQVSPERLREALVRDGILTVDQFEVYRKEADRLGQNVGGFLIGRNVITGDYFSRFLAEYLRVPIADLAGKQIDEKILNLLSPDLARRKRAVVFGREEDRVTVKQEPPRRLVENLLCQFLF